MPTIDANGLEIHYETFGSGPPILLIMGLGAQMTLWPLGFCEALANEGYRVIRYDNRDIGLSSKMDGQRVPSFAKMMLWMAFRRPFSVPYTMNDMAQDAIGLLDALDIDRAHVVGASMGGMIAQTLAIRHPHRLFSLTSIMSTTGQRRHAMSKRSALRALLTRPTTNDRAAIIENSVAVIRAIGSPAHFNEAEARELATTNYDRSFYPQGFFRQFAAVMAAPNRIKALRRVDLPSLVIHGAADPLVPLGGGKSTARAIPDATLRIYPTMGHDLPSQLWPDFVRDITTLIARAQP